MTTRTHTHTDSLLNLISERQATLHMTDDQLSQALGFDNANFLRLFKQGSAKFPFQKVTLLASALAINAATLLRLLMADTMPELLTLVDQFLAPAVTLTDNEAKLIESYRHLSKGRDVAPVVLDGHSIVALVVA